MYMLVYDLWGSDLKDLTSNQGSAAWGPTRIRADE